ncbi:hypothetical protein GCM10009557_11650 [Virgisporangium ochraceum]|uniref:DUF2637 domain-containing protein n=1 Tax=Virgisporangium ochraceum TaxID=65505 RepID=A0A8J3ZWS1_9ACTN|nr:hypothetical protein [Virgisporangium ochraceum]GIJ69885.1 hypothetical protein Voc01_048020 [Virgisporangium ochraceum]
MKRTGEPRLAGLASWLVLGASFGLSAATWVALGRLAGFEGEAEVFGAALALAWLMPVAVDGYVVVALLLWMAPVPPAVARFARANTYAAASIGVVAQSAYHALVVFAATGSAWRCVMAAVVGALPPAVAALAVHMRALLVRESSTAAAPAEVAPAAPSVSITLPPVEVVSAQVEVPAPPAEVPPSPPAVIKEPVGEVKRVEAPEVAPVEVPTEAAKVPAKATPRKAAKAPPAAPRRPFAVTQRAAAALAADGMAAPDIAVALGISVRQARAALKPVPLTGGGAA